jgi:hypothetical protein
MQRKKEANLPRESRKLSFRSKFIRNPIDEKLSKDLLLKATLDKTAGKELLGLLYKNYRLTKPPKPTTVTSPSSVNLLQMMEQRENAPLLDYGMKKLLKREALKGKIPDFLRRKIWLLASGAKANIMKYPNYYNFLKTEVAAYPVNFIDAIELDLKRTFPDKPNYDKNDPFIQKMRNVLHCYAKRNPAIGYCQGLNFIISKVLQIVSNEEEAFWLLTAIIEEYLPTDYFTSMEGVLVDQKIFRDIINLLYPELKKKFGQLQIDSSLFSLQWFVCLYSCTFPDALLFPLWDLLILEGCTILFKSGIFFVNKLKDDLKKVNEFHEVFQLIEEKSKQLSQSDYVDYMKKMDSIYINKRLLKFLREIFKYEIQKTIKEYENKKSRSHHPPMVKEPKDCSTKWPVCIDVIEKTDRADKNRPKSLFTYRIDRVIDRVMAGYFEKSNTNLTPTITITHRASITPKNTNKNTSVTIHTNLSSKIPGKTTPISHICTQLENVVIGRHNHVCKECVLEKEANAVILQEKAVKIEQMYKTIEENSPIVRGRYYSSKFNLSQGRPRNDGNNLYMGPNTSSPGKTSFATNQMGPIVPKDNNKKGGPVLAGAFQNALKPSPVKDTNNNADNNGMNSSQPLNKSIGLIKPTLITPVPNINTSMYSSGEIGKISHIMSNQSLDSGSKSFSRGGGENGNTNESFITGSDNYIEDSDDDSAARRDDNTDSFDDDNFEPRDHTKSVFDILEEVKENKNKLVDKFMEFNRSFILTKTRPPS